MRLSFKSVNQLWKAMVPKSLPDLLLAMWSNEAGISPLGVLVAGIFLHLSMKIFGRIYDVFFGPLSKIPGPKLAAATRLVMFRHILKGDAQHWRLKLHEKYGPVIRPSPKEVSFSTGEVWKQIYGIMPGVVPVRGNMRKDPSFYQVAPKGQPVGLGPAPDDVHDRQRKIFNRAFSERALTRQEPLLRSYTSQLLSNLSKIASNKEKADMVKHYNFTTFDIMGDLTYGEPLGCLQNSEYTPWISTIFANLTVLTFMVEMNNFPWARALINWMIPAKMKKKRQEHIQNSIKMIDKRLESKERRPDIWGLVLEANAEKPEEQRLQLGEMYGNSGLFMIAGTETSATLLSAVTFYLLRDPAKMCRLVTEIRTAFSSADDISLSKLTQLTYLNACLQEALRIHPPVPLSLPRLVPPGGSVLAGYYIPENDRENRLQLAFTNTPHITVPKILHALKSFFPKDGFLSLQRSLLTTIDPAFVHLQLVREAVWG